MSFPLQASLPILNIFIYVTETYVPHKFQDFFISTFIVLYSLYTLCYLNPARISSNLNYTADLVIPTGTQTNKANAEIKTQPVTVETNIRFFKDIK